MRNQIGHDFPALMTGGNVIKYELIRALVLVPARLMHGIAGIDMVKKLDAFDDSTAVNVKTGDDPAGQHDVRIEFSVSPVIRNWQWDNIFAVDRCRRRAR
jgi:hypothetical protein